jgi:hypothetical protein
MFRYRIQKQLIFPLGPALVLGRRLHLYQGIMKLFRRNIRGRCNDHCVGITFPDKRRAGIIVVSACFFENSRVSNEAGDKTEGATGIASFSVSAREQGDCDAPYPLFLGEGSSIGKRLVPVNAGCK